MAIMKPKAIIQVLSPLHPENCTISCIVMILDQMPTELVHIGYMQHPESKGTLNFDIMYMYSTSHLKWR